MNNNVSSDKNTALLKRRSSTGTTSQLHNFVKEHLLSDFKEVEHESSKRLEDVDFKQRHADVQLHTTQLQEQLQLKLLLHLDSSINSTDIDSLAGQQNSEISIAYSDDILSSSDEADQKSQEPPATTRKLPENTSTILPEKSEKSKKSEKRKASRNSKSPRRKSSSRSSSKSQEIPRKASSTRTSKSPRRPNSRTDQSPGRDPSATSTISRTSTKSLGRESCSSRTSKSPLRQRSSRSPMKRRSSRTSKNAGPSGRTTLERKDNSFQNIRVVEEQDTITPLKDHDLEAKAPGRSGRRRKNTGEKSSSDEGSSSIEEQAPTSSPSSLKASSGGRRKPRPGRRRSSKSLDPSESDNTCKRQQPRRGNSTSNPMRRISSSASSSEQVCLSSRSDHSPKHPTTRRSNSHNATPSRDTSPRRPMRRSSSKSPPPAFSRSEHFATQGATRRASSKSLLLPESGQDSPSNMLKTSTMPPQQPRPPLPSRVDDASVNGSPKLLPMRPPRRTISAQSPTRVSSFASTGSTTTSDDRCPRIPVRRRARPSSSSSGVLQPSRKFSDPPMSLGTRSEHTPTRVSSSSSQQSSLDDSTSEFSVLSRASSFGIRKSYHPSPNNKPQRSTTSSTRTSLPQANHNIRLTRQPLSMVPKSSSAGILSDAGTQTKHNQMMSPGNIIGSSSRGSAKSIMLAHQSRDGGHTATTSSDASDVSTKRLAVDLQKTPFAADGDEVSTTEGATAGSDCSR